MTSQPSPTPYGTLFRVRLRPDASEDQLRAHLEHWQRTLGPRFPGSTLDLLMRVDSAPGDYLVLHLFASREAYAAMDGDAEQDRWYHDLVALLAAEPAFTDVAQVWRVG